jgi:hypothetical protein
MNPNRFPQGTKTFPGSQHHMVPPTPQMPFSPNVEPPRGGNSMMSPFINPNRENTNPNEIKKTNQPNMSSISTPFDASENQNYNRFRPTTPGFNGLTQTNMTPGTPFSGNMVQKNNIVTHAVQNIVGIVDDNYIIDKNEELFHKSLHRIDSENIGAKGTTALQELVRKQYETLLPSAILATQREIDDTTKQLEDCSDYITAQIEELAQIKATKVVPTWMHQLAVIYKLPLPDLSQSNGEDIKYNINPELIPNTVTKLEKVITELELSTKKGANQKELASLNNYPKAITPIGAQSSENEPNRVVNLENAQNIVEELCSVRLQPEFEPNQTELDKLTKELQKEFKQKQQQEMA